MADKPQYVTFSVADDLFAVPIERVQEILELRAIARLPQSPSNLLGMIDVRTRGVPVIDLRTTLGRAVVEDTPATRIVVLSIENGGRQLTVGLKTDRVFEVTVLDETTLDPPPEFGTGWVTHAIAGIGRRNGAFVTVFDLDRLLGTTELPPASADLVVSQAA